MDEGEAEHHNQQGHVLIWVQVNAKVSVGNRRVESYLTHSYPWSLRKPGGRTVWDKVVGPASG